MEEDYRQTETESSEVEPSGRREPRRTRHRRRFRFTRKHALLVAAAGVAGYFLRTDPIAREAAPVEVAERPPPPPSSPATHSSRERLWIARRIEGKWHTIVENVASSAIKVKPGETNVLRVKASGDSATFLINGEKVRDLRGQAPRGGWRFGLSGDNFDKDKYARLVFRSVKVTN